MANGRRLIMGDGTVFEEGECGYAEHQLWCWIKNITFAEAFAVFSNPFKTNTIRFIHSNIEEIYTGFTTINIIKQSEFTVDIRLVGENTSVEIIDHSKDKT